VTAAVLSVRGVRKDFGSTPVLRGVDLEIADPKAGHKLTSSPVRAAEDSTAAGDKIVGHERDPDIVVGATLERVELAT